MSTFWINLAEEPSSEQPLTHRAANLAKHLGIRCLMMSLIYTLQVLSLHKTNINPQRRGLEKEKQRFLEGPCMVIPVKAFGTTSRPHRRCRHCR